MQAIDAELPPSYGVRYFSRLYQQATLEIQRGGPAGLRDFQPVATKGLLI
jgi:hypothetical protein